MINDRGSDCANKSRQPAAGRKLRHSYGRYLTVGNAESVNCGVPTWKASGDELDGAVGKRIPGPGRSPSGKKHHCNS